jgi:hypothetical protein
MDERPTEMDVRPPGGELRSLGLAGGPSPPICRPPCLLNCANIKIDSMTTPYANVARAAASRLAADLGSDLPALTERALAQEGAANRRRSFEIATTLAVAGFLLSAVQLGWQVYRDLKAEREKKEQDTKRQTLQLLVRRMRLALDPAPDLTPQQQDRLLEVVAEEILAGESLPD